MHIKNYFSRPSDEPPPNRVNIFLEFRETGIDHVLLELWKRSEDENDTSDLSDDA